MRRMISRPARAVLPLAMAICAVLVPGAAQRALDFFAALMLARGLSLAAGGALRAAAGAVVRASRMRGNLLTAAVTAILGGAAAMIICMFDIPYMGRRGLWVGFAGAAVNMSQVIADRMYASDDRNSAAAYDMVIAALTTVGLMVSGTDEWLMALLTLSTTAAGLLLLSGLKNGTTLQLGFQVLKFSPLALFRGWLFPAFLTAGSVIVAELETDISAMFIAIAILEFCEPVYRRSDDESHACSVWLPAIELVAAAVCAALWYSEACLPEWYSRAPIFSLYLAEVIPLACIGAMLTGVHLNARRIFAVILMTIPALALVSILLAIPDMKALRRMARARRIQRSRI